MRALSRLVRDALVVLVATAATALVLFSPLALLGMATSSNPSGVGNAIATYIGLLLLYVVTAVWLYRRREFMLPEWVAGSVLGAAAIAFVARFIFG